MKIDLRKFSKKTIDKAKEVCNVDDESKLILLTNSFGGDAAYAELCVAIAAISYNNGFVDGIAALTVELLECNKEEKGGNIK